MDKFYVKFDSKEEDEAVIISEMMKVVSTYVNRRILIGGFIVPPKLYGWLERHQASMIKPLRFYGYEIYRG